MSLLKKLKNAVVGGAVGFVSGGYAGAAAGAAAGFSAGNPRKTKNVGYDPRVNVTKGKIQLDPNLSPIQAGYPAAVGSVLGISGSPLSSPINSNALSASGLVRNAGANFMTSGFTPTTGMVQPALFPSGGAGATGSFGPIASSSGISPIRLYHMFYTKKGTPRRLKRNGEPYKPPHMNPMNPRAARRAIRRIRGARKLLQRIERSLPKARARTHTHSRAA